MCKNLIMGPAKLKKVSPEGDFKDSITRKRWLGSKGGGGGGGGMVGRESMERKLGDDKSIRSRCIIINVEKGIALEFQ